MFVALTDSAVYTVWWISLAAGAVVIIVVALLLTLELRTVRQVLRGVEAIWTVGQQIANNTVHLSMLAYTNRIAGQILDTAGGIAQATERIESHAAGCPGCPYCLAAHPGR